MGLVGLERRQLFDALQIFNDLIQCCVLDEGQKNADTDQGNEDQVFDCYRKSRPLIVSWCVPSFNKK